MPKTYTLEPYKTQFGDWTFTTPTDRYPELPKRSEAENALVGGIDSMLNQIDSFTATDFAVTFSDAPMEKPKNILMSLTLSKLSDQSEFGGTYYWIEELAIQGWLCPVLNDYYPESPEILHLQILAK